MTESTAVSKTSLRAGWIISILCILFFLLDALMKVFLAVPSVEASAQLGWPANLVPLPGYLLLVCTILYAVPRTAVLGAVLLTGYLGGATAIMVRAQMPFWFPPAIGALAWVGVYLRSARLKQFIKY